MDASSPVPMSFEGTVTSEDTILSPLTGVLAAALRVRLLARRPPTTHPQTRDPILLGSAEIYTRVADVWYGEFIVVREPEGGELVVATAGLGLRTTNADRGATRLGPATPPELLALLGSVPDGLASYRESVVRHGQKVRVQATVFPIGARRWETRPGEGPVVLHEIGPAPGGKRRVS